MYKTKKNLETVWNQLDDACGSLDNASYNLGSMTGLPEEVNNLLDSIDLTRIVSLKNEIERLIFEKEEDQNGKN